MRTPLPILAAAVVGVVIIGAAVGYIAAREARLCAVAGPDDPTPADLGAAEARDHLRWCDPDGAW